MNLLFVDVETGGLDHEKHGLLEIGVIAVIDGVVKDKLAFYVRYDSFYYKCEPEAMAINNIDLKDVKELGFTPMQAGKALNDFVRRVFEGEKPILVGHNVSFDKGFLNQQIYKDCGLVMDDHISHRMIDTCSLIWGLIAAGKVSLKSASSSAAFEYFDITVNARHRALGDAEATLTLYNKLIELMK